MMSGLLIDISVWLASSWWIRLLGAAFICFLNYVLFYSSFSFYKATSSHACDPDPERGEGYSETIWCILAFIIGLIVTFSGPSIGELYFKILISCLILPNIIRIFLSWSESPLQISQGYYHETLYNPINMHFIFKGGWLRLVFLLQCILWLIPVGKFSSLEIVENFRQFWIEFTMISLIITWYIYRMLSDMINAIGWRLSGKHLMAGNGKDISWYLPCALSVAASWGLVLLHTSFYDQIDYWIIIGIGTVMGLFLVFIFPRYHRLVR